MTGDQKRSFERQWPELARALRVVLARRGVSAPDREDIIQETALRLVRVWDTADHGRPILPLAMTIALNLMRDHMRRPQREIALEAAADAPARSNVEHEVLSRLDLQRVAKAMRALSESHGAVLIQEVDDQPRGIDRGPDAMKMLRMRARRRLSALLESASAFVGLAALKIRSTTNEMSQSAAGAIAAMTIVMAMPASSAGTIVARPVGDAPSLHAVPLHPRSVSPASQPHVSAGARSPAASPILGAPDPSPEEGRHPIVVPLGDQGHVGAEGDLDINDVHAEVSDRGGPVPVCLDGVPGLPDQVDCPDN